MSDAGKSVGPDPRAVVLFLISYFLHVKISVTLFRIYLGMVTCFRARLCWGGNVTFLGIYSFPLYCWCQCGLLDYFRYGVM